MASPSHSQILPSEADIVIAGGGTAACVIAARLTEARPDWDIVMIEAGVDTMGNEDIQIPALSVGQVYQKAETVKIHMAKASKLVNGRELPVATGHCMGGGTSVNFMTYNNPAASDYDDWNRPGWSFEELQPYLRKKEDFHAPDPKAVHGGAGPMYAGFGEWRAPIQKSFDKVMGQLGIPNHEDMFDYTVGNGFGNSVRFVSTNGKRQTAAGAYLEDRGHRKTSSRIKVFTGKMVSRAIIQNGVAIGVEVVDSASSSSSPIIIRARQQVVVSAGAMGSAPLLERSGFGDAKILGGLGIEVVQDLPGVGSEYEDHQAGFSGVIISPDQVTHDFMMNQDMDAIGAAMEEWKKSGKGPLSSNVQDGILRLRPTEDELSTMGPDFQRHWAEIGKDKPDKPLLFMINNSTSLGVRDGVSKDQKTTGLCWIYNYPASRGYMHISSKDPHAPLDFDTGMLSHPADLPVHVWAYKKMRSILRRLDVFEGEIPAGNPKFGQDSKAGMVTEGAPLVGPDPEYSAEDDRAIEEWVRDNIGTCWHSMATCPMRRREHGGVVDTRLNVYGVKRLKVADLSICPSNVGCNTATVALTIGEKAADMILQDLQ